MDGDHRSRDARDKCDEKHQHNLVLSHHRRDFFTGDRGQACFVYRDGECPEKKIGKCRLGVSSHAADQNAHRRRDGHAGGQTSRKRGEEQRKHYVQVDQT